MHNNMAYVAEASGQTNALAYPGRSRRTVLLAAAAALAGTRAPLAEADSEAGVCTFGVFPYLPPPMIGDRFSLLAAEFEGALGTSVQLRTKETFDAFADELGIGHYDIALVHPFLYVDCRAKQDYVPLARVDQDLRAVIVSRQRAALSSLADLRGQTLALPDKLAAVASW
jgi:phosphonate transport system substrate-binding protein